MGTYSKIWIGSALTLLVVGDVTGFLLDPGTALILLVLGTASGTAVGIAAERGRLSTWALLGGVVVVGSMGLAQLDVRLFVGVLVILGLVSPPVVRPLLWGAASPHHRPPTSRRGHLLGHVPPQPGPGMGRPGHAWQFDATALPAYDQPTLLAMAEHLRLLDDRELCRAWRRSYLVLDASVSPATRLAVVQLRQAYLDELGRRRPDALQAWFDAGGRAASGPDKFFLDAS